MLHWAAGAEGKGVVCSADIAIVNLDRKSFAFMRSIPNHIPLSEKAVRAIGAALMPLAFDRVYSHHFERVMHSGAKQILQSSVERYAAAIGGAYDRAEAGENAEAHKWLEHWQSGPSSDAYQQPRAIDNLSRGRAF